MNFSNQKFQMSACAILLKSAMISAALSGVAFGSSIAPADWDFFETKHLTIDKGISKWRLEIPFGNHSQSIWDIKMKDIPEQIHESCVIDTDGGGRDCTSCAIQKQKDWGQ